jgi:DNA-binding NarL/FixJ family response regulator
MVRASLQGLDRAEFIEAGTGLQAIEQLALVTVQLVVLDLNMPDMLDRRPPVPSPAPALSRFAGHHPDDARRRGEPRDCD